MQGGPVSCEEWTGLQRLALAERETRDEPPEASSGWPVRSLIAPGMSVAFFHRKEEEYRVLLPFIKEGFEQGDRAFHIVDPRHRPEHSAGVCKKWAIPVAEAEGKGQLEVRRWGGLPTCGTATSTRNRMLALIEEVLTGGKAQGFPLEPGWLANMEWALEDRPGVDDVVEYETPAELRPAQVRRCRLLNLRCGPVRCQRRHGHSCARIRW